MEHQPDILLVYHHSYFYQKQQALYLRPLMGKLLDFLAPHFKEILFISTKSLNGNEGPLSINYEITADNVKAYALADANQLIKSIIRARRIKTLKKQLEEKSVYLYAYGPTHHLSQVFSIIKPQKTLLHMVGAFTPPNNLIKRYRHKCMVSGYRKLLRNQNVQIAANSYYLQNYYTGYFGKEIAFIPTSLISNNDIQTDKPKRNNQQLKVITVARLESRKGIWELLNAINELNGYDNVQFTWFGSATEPGIEKAINEYLKLHPFVKSHFKLGGELPYGQPLFEKLKNADVFVLPTHQESFPKALTEACAFLCPIVTTTVGDIPNVFTHNKTAFLVQPHMIDKLAAALKTLINDEGLSNCLAEAAIPIAKKRSLETVATLIHYTFTREKAE